MRIYINQTEAQAIAQALDASSDPRQTAALQAILDKLNPSKITYHVCSCPVPWTDPLALSYARDMPESRAHRSLIAAVRNDLRMQPKGTNMYLDTRVLASNDGGRTYFKINSLTLHDAYYHAQNRQ